MPIACGIGFFCPKELFPDLKHVWKFQRILDDFSEDCISFFERYTSNGHRVFERFPTVICNFKCKTEGVFTIVNVGNFQASVFQGFFTGNRNVFALEYGGSQNLRVQGIATEGAVMARVQNRFPGSKFQVQMGIPDSRASRIRKCIPFLKCGDFRMVDRDIVLFGFLLRV